MATKVSARIPAKKRRSPMEHPRHQYPRETAALQEIAKSCGLTEKIKWGKPCFTFQDKNIVLIQRFNNYIALMFFQGALLNDPDERLYRIGEMQTPRQLRFTSVAEVTSTELEIRAFITAAIALEQSGAKAERKPTPELAMPEELRTKLDANPTLKKAFAALTPGRQKGYLFQIAAAKQSQTRVSRIDQYAPRILAGKGFRD